MQGRGDGARAAIYSDGGEDPDMGDEQPSSEAQSNPRNKRTARGDLDLESVYG